MNKLMELEKENQKLKELVELWKGRYLAENEKILSLLQPVDKNAEKALLIFADDENWFRDDRFNLPIEFNVNASNDPSEIAKEAIRKMYENVKSTHEKLRLEFPL